MNIHQIIAAHDAYDGLPGTGYTGTRYQVSVRYTSTWYNLQSTTGYSAREEKDGGVLLVGVNSVYFV